MTLFNRQLLPEEYRVRFTEQLEELERDIFEDEEYHRENIQTQFEKSLCPLLSHVHIPESMYICISCSETLLYCDIDFSENDSMTIRCTNEQSIFEYVCINDTRVTGYGKILLLELILRIQEYLNQQ